MKNNDGQRKHNPLKLAYENIWVPFLGRILMFFVKWIEGKPPQEEPSFDLRDKGPKR